MSREILSVDDLFPSYDDENFRRSNPKLDVNSLARNFSYDKQEELNFNSDILLKNIIERRKLLRNTHVKLYNACCQQIKEVDGLNNGVTSIIFTLDKKYDECPFLNHMDCIKYIDENLKKELLDTYVMNDRQIFVTWKFIELNKQMVKKDDNDD